MGCSFHYCYASNIPVEDEYLFQGVSLFGEQNKDLDLSKFQDEHYIEEGQYFWNVLINEQDKSQQVFVIVNNPQTQKNEVCFNLDQLKKLGIQNKHIAQAETSACIFSVDVSPFLKYEISQQDLKIKLTVPDALLLKSQEISMPEQGINSFFLNFNYNYNRSEQRNADSIDEQHFLGLQTGLNVYGWYLRHQSFLSVENNIADYQSGAYTLYRDVLSKKARLGLGHVNVSGSNSVPVYGVMFETDPLMRPEAERYYTPIVENIAQTHALVKVYQNGRLLLEKSVTPGPFKLERVTGLDRNGDLKVEIHEANQQVRSFTVPYAMQQSLLRQKQLNYRVTYGDFVERYQPTGQKVLQGEFEYGLRYNTSISSSMNYAQGYFSGAWGAIYNHARGGFALQADYAKAEVLAQQGYKLQLNYQVGPLQSGTNINVRATYNAIDFPSLSDAIQASSSNMDRTSASESIRQDWGINLSHNFTEHFGNLSVSALWRNYWKSPKQYAQFQLNYANTWRKFKYNVSYSHTYNSQASSDRTLFFGLSLPMSKLSTQVQQQQMPEKTMQSSVIYNDVYGQNQQWKYSLNAGNLKDQYGESSTFGANLSYSGQKLQSAGAFNHSEDSRQLSFNGNGAIVVHRHGITLSKAVSDTFAIGHIDTGEKLKGSKKWGEGYDRWGNAVYTNISPYQENSVGFNPTTLPLSVNLETMTHELRPRRFSTPLVVFKAEHHENIVLILNLDGERAIPIGATLETQVGDVFGLAGQSNQIFLKNRQYLKSGTQLRWGKKADQQCELITIQNEETSSAPIQILEATCRS